MKTINYITSFVLMMLTINGSHSDGVEKWALVGQPTEITCPVLGTPRLLLCHWERLDNEDKPNFELQYPPVVSNSTEYVPVGDGSSKCGIQILNVSTDDLMIWKSSSLHRENGSTLFSNCSITLMMAVKPTSPAMTDIGSLVDEDGIDRNSTVDVKCCSKGGVPPPEIGFVYDGAEVPAAVTETDDNLTTCITWSNASFSWLDDRKEVKCFQKHLTYEGMYYTSQNLTILYGPKLRSANVPTFTYTVSANPKPSVFLYSEVQISLEMNITYPNTWDIVLTPIFDLIFDDIKIDLEVYNLFGKLNINVTLLGPTTTTVKTARLDQKDVHQLLYIAAGTSAAVILIISIILVISRQRGLLCYKERARSYPLQVVYDGNDSQVHPGIMDNSVSDQSSSPNEMVETL